MSGPAPFDRYCDPDEVWVCGACGRFVEHDAYSFEDASCSLNARPLRRELLEFSADNRHVLGLKGVDATCFDGGCKA